MMFSAFRILGQSFKRFNDDGCGTSAVVISYFLLLCVVPLVALFAFISARILGSSEIAFRSLNIFTDEFFANMDPIFFRRLEVLSEGVSNLGLFGLVGSVVAASFVFSNLIGVINKIFRAEYHKSFFYNRLMEFILMFSIGVIMLFSLSITAVWTAVHRSLRESAVAAEYLSPELLSVVNNFFIQYIMPYALTFLVMFMIYKFIPEVRVDTLSVVIAAAVAALLWEAFKRLFAFYIANLSVVGIVLSRLLQGTLTSIIFFLLWITFSLSILLWGAELAAVLNERRIRKVGES